MNQPNTTMKTERSATYPHRLSPFLLAAILLTAMPAAADVRLPKIFTDNVGSGLMVGKKAGREPAAEDKGAALKGFAIAGADKKWAWAKAVIEGETVTVFSPEVKDPVAVRYAFQMNPDGANLYNRDGLPASPFRSDDW